MKNNTELVGQLLQGSRNLDRMETEIKQFIHMTLGLVGSITCAPPDTRPIKARFATLAPCPCVWEVSGKFPNDLCVVCRARNDDTILLIVSGNRFEFRYPKITVQQIHQSLNVFAEGMAQEVPALAKAWQPFIDAASVFE